MDVIRDHLMDLTACPEDAAGPGYGIPPRPAAARVPK